MEVSKMAEEVRNGRYVPAAVTEVVVTGGSEFDKLLKRYVATGFLTTFRALNGDVVKPAWPVSEYGKKIADLIKLKVMPSKFFVYQEAK
jgi:hypothetical protein